MSQFYVQGGGSGGSGIQTISGDSGSITGSTVTIYTHYSSGYGTPKFINSGTISTLQFWDSADNLTIGRSVAGGALLGGGGQFNTAFGNQALESGSSNENCTAIGDGALATDASGQFNTSIGAFSLEGVNGGGNNSALGYGAGSNYGSTESYNIVIGSNIFGTVGESNVIRIGSTLPGTSNSVIIGDQGFGTAKQNKCFIAGIAGATIAAGSPTPYLTLTDTSDGQIVCPTPSSSHTVIGSFGSITLGTAKQNTSLFPILVNVNIAVTASTAGTISMGVGSTSTPTTDIVVPAFTVAAFTNFSVSAVVPAGYYLLVSTGGAVTVSSTTTWSCQVG